MHSDARSIVSRGDALFSQKQPLDSRNQDIADQFYPERADFTVSRSVGADWADHLTTGYPAMVRRDLGNSLGSMLRPKGQPWFHTRVGHDDKAVDDHEAAKWLEKAETIQRRAMYDRKSLFTRATKEADHDFAAFGGAVLSTELNRRDNTLLYRCWHLRDTVWAEDSYGQIGEVHRNWKPTAVELCQSFPKTVDDKVRELAGKDPHATVSVRHCVIRSDCYCDGKYRQPWVSLFIDVANQSILEERGSWTQIYTIPRWATISGSQYAYSPASLIALPDARLLQAMTLSLLDAGERAANPPMIGVAEAIRGDLNIYPGGFTAVDAEYDERLGEVLRPLTQDKSGLSFGLELSDRTSQMLREAFYLNTLSMPPAGGGDMTAYEVGQRVQEYIRNALPLFEPMENDYNAALCEITFETMMRAGAFGPPDDIPQSIRGQEVSFAFESPLAQMIERQKGQKFLEAKAMIAEATAVDPSAVQIMDFKTTLRDVLNGIGAPAKWLRSPEQVAEAESADAAKAQAAQLLGTMQQGADVAETLGRASQTLGVQ
jgi:Bacteriophage head to tail connecting protein